jgi:hypothetical protein
MKLYLIGFVVLGTFWMGCAETKVGTTTVTAADVSKESVAPGRLGRQPAVNVVMDRADPYDGAVFAKPTWEALHEDPWDGTPMPKLSNEPDRNDPYEH